MVPASSSSWSQVEGSKPCPRIAQVTSRMRSAAAKTSRVFGGGGVRGVGPCRFRVQGVGLDLGDLRAGAGDGLGHLQKIGAEALLGLLASFRADHRLDALDGGQEELGVGTAVPPGIFLQEPASALGMHQGRANGIVIALRRRRGRNLGDGKEFFRHVRSEGPPPAARINMFERESQPAWPALRRTPARSRELRHARAPGVGTPESRGRPFLERFHFN